MKKIQASIRPEKLDPVRTALAAKGFHAMASAEGHNTPPGRVRLPPFRGRRTEGDRIAGVTIETTVHDDEVSEAVATIRAAACTGNYGDGKILVFPEAMEQVGRIAVWMI
ncbi:MAG: P-II family nitrogen regulator [Methanomicrobiaceae archaeon]|nr:P-II family nitrogen regulator [Methanomicrobiaceae archaeon]